jgi:hypothetical protein
MRKKNEGMRYEAQEGGRIRHLEGERETGRCGIVRWIGKERERRKQRVFL